MKNNLFWKPFILAFLMACQSSYDRTNFGVKTTIDSTEVEIQFYSPEIVRIVKSKPGFKWDKESLSVIKEPEKVDISVLEQEQQLMVSSDQLQVTLDLVNGVLSYARADGSPLLHEKSDGTSFTPVEDLGVSTFSVKQTFELEEDEYIYGLGQYQKGKMSQRNQTLKMIQLNKETVVPFLYSNKNYGLFWDNYAPTVFSDSVEATAFDSEIGDCIDYYVMAGEDADGVIANMRALTGQAPMMPYWTYGFWQSKERYKSQEEIVGVVEKYRSMGIPIDGIIQDWQYWGDNYHWNAMEFLNPKFPNPQQMVDQIHALNAHMIISCWASFGPQTKQYEVLKGKDMLFDFKTWPLSGVNTWPADMNKPSGVSVYDVYHPEALDIYWDYLNSGLFSLGIDGWWLDSSEPDHMRVEEKDFDNKTNLGSFRRVRNAFPIQHVGGVASHQRAASDEKRVFILTRSAFAGQQRHAANSWSGDVVADWESLRQQISAGLNFSLTGIPYWNSDIGGFFLWNFPGGDRNIAYHELYVRWMQFGAFCPMMRSHGTDAPRELWYYGKEGDWAYDALKKMISLRYRLLPYIYSTSWEVTQKQSSMMRALVMDFAHDEKVLDIDNQYLFGKSMLVCPVTEPMYVSYRKEGKRYHGEEEDFSQVKTHPVYLPEGTKWVDFWSGEVLAGGQVIDRKVPIDLLPLYVKAGSIIPFGPDVQYANEEIGPLTIRVYPGADATFTFYDDERDNYNYENGAFATIEMKWEEEAQVFTLEEQKGTYEGIPEVRKIRIVKVEGGAGTGMPAQEEQAKVVEYVGDRIAISL